MLGHHAGGGGQRRGVLVGRGQDVEDVADEQLVDALELAAQDLGGGEDVLGLAVDGGLALGAGGVRPEGGEVEPAVLEGDCDAFAADRFGGAAELLHDVGVVLLQEVDEAVPRVV